MPPSRRATPAIGFVKTSPFTKRNIHNEKAHALDLSLIFVPGDRPDREDGGCPLPDVQSLRLGSLRTSPFSKDEYAMKKQMLLTLALFSFLATGGPSRR